MEILRKTTQGHLFKSDDATGEIEAIVSVFGNVDSYGERCVLGCFEESIGAKLPKGVWMHNWSEPIAKTLEAKELAPGDAMLPDAIKENGGLFIKAKFFKEIDDSWQAYMKIKNGLVDEYSIGYRNLKVMKDEESNILDLVKIDLYEWSPVLKGANPATSTLSIKAMLGDPHYGCDLDVHTDLLTNRWKETLEAREAKGELTPAFVTRLKEAADKLAALVSDSSTDRDSEGKAKTADLEWEASRHAAKMRQIRSGAIS